ncbi:MAG: UDP-N-acetylglucosamine 2-epimerase [Nanoarchaeota archaeon]
MNQIDSFIRDWSDKKTINGKSFDEIFQIGSVPLWWFYRRIFVEHVLPKPINTFRYIRTKTKISLPKKIKYSISSKILGWFIYYNENAKIKYTAEKKALFITYTNHILSDKKLFRIQNIIDKINDNKKMQALPIFVDPLSSTQYKRLSSYTTIYNYYDKTISNKAKQKAVILHKLWQNIDLRTRQNMLKLNSISLYPYLKFGFDIFFSKQFLYLLILYSEIAKKIIIDENVKKIVLTAQNGLFEKCILAAAKDLKISSVFIQHGIAHKMSNPDSIHSTKIAVFSEHYKKRMMKVGVKKDNIVVSGPVIFDEVIKYSGPKKRYKNNKLLIVTQPYVEDFTAGKRAYFEIIRKLLNDIKNIKNIKVIIKLHPREKYKQNYESILKKLNFKDYQIQKDITRDEFYKLIKWCDAFINFGTTAAIEAMIIDRPIITIDLHYGRTNIIIDSNATKNVSYKKDLQISINQAIEQDRDYRIKREKLLKKLCQKVDGKAFERVAKIIEDVE